MKTQFKYIPYDKNLTEKARTNRKNSTPAEKRMWYDLLGNKSFQGLKFTRQKPLDRYIVDFYCSELMLVIEIDGDTHSEQEEYDIERTKRLESFGITVLRYTNLDVMDNFESVYEDLVERVEVLRKRLSDRTAFE